MVEHYPTAWSAVRASESCWVPHASRNANYEIERIEFRTNPISPNSKHRHRYSAESYEPVNDMFSHGRPLRYRVE